MNIDYKTYEKAIYSSCIQLAQAYSVTFKITIDDAKDKVGKYLTSLSEFKPNKQMEENKDLKQAVQQAIRNCDGKKEKAYLELLKLQELFD